MTVIDKEKAYQNYIIWIIIIALGFRLLGITNPFLDFHSWRQTLTATVAQNFYLWGMNIFHPSTNVIPQTYEFEFHLYTYLVAIAYKIFGFHEIWGRVISILFSLGTIPVLFKLINRYYNERTAILSVFFYAVLPMSVYYGRTFMPEATLIFFIVSALYYFTLWAEGEKWSDYIVAIACTTLAILVKLPSGYILIPLTYIALRKSGFNGLLNLRLILFYLAVLIPPLMWYSYTDMMHTHSTGGSSIWLKNDKIFNINILTDINFYREIFLTRLGEKMFAFTLYPLVITGLFLKIKDKKEIVFLTWFLSVILYFLLVARGNFVHEYYQIPIIPVGVAFAGKTIDRFISWYQDRQNARYKYRRLMGIFIIIMIAFIPPTLYGN